MPELAPLLARDVRVVSAHGALVPNGIWELGLNEKEARTLLSGLHQSQHLILFQLHVMLYERALERAR